MSYKILAKKEICPNQYEIQIEAPYVVRNAKAGQFIIFRATKDGERVPLTIADVDKENGILTLVFMAVGYSTKQLASLNVGDELQYTRDKRVYRFKIIMKQAFSESANTLYLYTLSSIIETLGE